jgi:hemerythrin
VAIAWDPSLAVGIAEIDAQHRELFARIGALLDAIQSGTSRDEVGKTLDYLSRYAVEHFSAEEKIMRDRQYPGREAHEAEHRQFQEDLAGLEADLVRDGPTALLVVRVNARVAMWFRDHIYRTDKALAAFLLDPYLAYSRR